MKMKLSKLNYQRNGVSGEPFFSLLAENLTDTKGNFLITFDASENDNKINSTTCRVVEINNPTLSWRGDRVANDLQKEINNLMNKHKVNNIYDLKGKC